MTDAGTRKENRLVQCGPAELGADFRKVWTDVLPLAVDDVALRTRSNLGKDDPALLRSAGPTRQLLDRGQRLRVNRFLQRKEFVGAKSNLVHGRTMQRGRGCLPQTLVQFAGFRLCQHARRTGLRAGDGT